MGLRSTLDQLSDALAAAWMRRSLPRLAPSKLVAVAVPLSNRPGFTTDEAISLRHLNRYLAEYDRYFIAPPGLDVEYPGIGVKRFPSRYFGSVTAHRDLLFSPTLYRAFVDYEFLLVYHLDALALSDRLVEWCGRGYDYVAPPWVPHPDAPYAGNPAYEGKVGNGGFSLRRVGSFLRLVLSTRPAIGLDDYSRRYLAGASGLARLTRLPKRWMMRSPWFNNARWELRRWRLQNDERFIVERAAHYVPGFRIAPLETALEFAFECVPRHCFELTGHRLPFGCHAWPKYDREFWEPYLLDGSDGEEGAVSRAARG